MSCTQKQQLVCFPKVRVYKPWFRHFNDHKDFRNEGTVHLFSLMALFSYANFRSNERVINGDRYMEAPGQWICKLGALPRILRVHSKAQALKLMEYFQDHGFLTFEILDEEKEILRFTIADWKEHCTHLQYNYYSYKGSGFFFFPLPVGRLLLKTGRARTSIDRLDIKLQENSWNIDADGSFEMSGLEMSSMQRPDGSEYYSFNDFDVSSYKGPAGYGFAVDLGVTYDVIPDLQLSFAVNDLGFISWGKKYLERGQMTKSQSFTGVEIIDGEVHDPEFDFGELEFDRVQASKGKTEMLRTSINLGAEYEVWRHKIGLGLLYNVRVWDVKTFHNLTASVNFHPIPWFTLTTSYSFLNGQGHALGVAINACPSWINFFLATDMLICSHTPQFLPVTSTSMNVTLGIGVPIGRRSHRIPEYLYR